ncbi:MAG TPA: SH3 domain-containing protein [Candidatus Limnocylindria bacterium]|nr:SH3 domain-containing protein [Candidatus Limnocylindria bacterium]
MRRLSTLVLCAALGLPAQGCAGQSTIVMASGRDDHGLLTRPAIGLQRSPTDATVVGSVPDGAFLRVIEVDHSWLRVRTLTLPPEEGWVSDHDLRGTAELLTAHRQVRFRDARTRGGVVEIQVEPLDGSAAIWVAATDLREVGAVVGQR